MKMAIALLCVISGLCCIGLGVYFLHSLFSLDEINRELDQYKEELHQSSKMIDEVNDKIDQYDKTIQTVYNFSNKILEFRSYKR